MKILISTDIEGVAELTTFSEANPRNIEYKKFQKIMTKELLAICKILGDNQIIIRDSHWDGKNLDKRNFSNGIKLIQGFDGSLNGMVNGIDFDVDGVILHGYHSAAGSNASLVSHTFNNETVEYIKLNNRIIGETTISMYTCALYNVPVFYIEGEESAINEAKYINKNIITTITKENNNNVIKSSDIVIEEIKSDLLVSINKLKENKEMFMISLPNSFELEMRFKNRNHRIWNKENVKKINEYTIRYNTSDFLDILKLLK